ncbi:Peroxisome biosynthesis protein pex1 [Scheffersomyces spartinae]|uniref:Peroxisomal ATPase PEX1 n=1 Tax=Scheffersomyces spartinae TaxID=45513 RepID=A0A9P7V7N8_9ASCO|nr:Peroxisome biosynthesis protein pex1 [Scheffersomyces spartinae]KAG7192618.1 Peroxisome biosynthesis protein pex1 [Scheffersomyces spartinae]
MNNHRLEIELRGLRSNLVNLPNDLCTILFNADIKVQDVVIEIVAAKGQKWYAGWSGQVSGAPKTLEMDPTFAQSLQLSGKEKITVNLKLNPFESSEVIVEPVSSSDWELTELHSQTIQDKLLSQTRCVALHQPLIAYPTPTTCAHYIVTDLGNPEMTFVKLAPFCDLAIKPKMRVKKSDFTPAKSVKSVASNDDSANNPSVVKRGISLPHNLFEICSIVDYEVYVNGEEVMHVLERPEFVLVAIVPGPTYKWNRAPAASETKDKEKENVTAAVLNENKRVIAKLVHFPSAPKNTIGLSEKLAIALGVENEVGSMVLLLSAVSCVSKRPGTFTIHPYITATRRNNQLSLNERKEEATRLADALTNYFYKGKTPLSASPLTNYLKLPIIPGILPHGGLLKFKRNDAYSTWVKPHNGKKPSKIEIGEELLRSVSFIQEFRIESNYSNEAIGLDSIISGIVDSIAISPNSSTLVHGNAGSGKTLILQLVSEKLNSEHGYHTKYIACETIMNENANQLMGRFTKWIQECNWSKPSLLILDNLDKILPCEIEHGDSGVSVQLSEFLISQIQRVQAQNHSNLSLLLSSTSKESLNKLLLQCHLVDDFLHLSAPDKNIRLQIIETYLGTKLNCEIKFDVMDAVSETEGYLPNDLKILCDRIFHEVLVEKAQKKIPTLAATKKHLEKAIIGYVPSNLRGVKLEKSSTSWEDIGGLKGAKDLLLETLEWPTKYAPIFANCPLRLRSGILLYGYPGCGKTLLASAVAGQCGLNFISIKGPEILNKYIGASEQSVRELFERAQAAKPCILFFDEFDSIAPKRGHDSTGVTDRVVNQMLTQMDGAEGLDGVYVLAATSRPDLIDSALLRPGRLDKSVICDMPNYEDRLDILKCVAADMDFEDDVNLREIAEKTAGFSGADMQGLGYNAYLKAVHVKLSKDEEQLMVGASASSGDENTREFLYVSSEKLKKASLRPSERLQILKQIEQIFNSKNTENNKNKTSNNDVKIPISHQNFVDSLEETKPSISVKERLKLDNIYSQFVSDRDGNMPDGSASNDIGARTSLM